MDINQGPDTRSRFRRMPALSDSLPAAGSRSPCGYAVGQYLDREAKTGLVPGIHVSRAAARTAT